MIKKSRKSQDKIENFPGVKHSVHEEVHRLNSLYLTDSWKIPSP